MLRDATKAAVHIQTLFPSQERLLPFEHNQAGCLNFVWILKKKDPEFPKTSLLPLNLFMWKIPNFFFIL